MSSDIGDYNALLRKLDLRVSQVMQQKPATIPQDSTIEDAAKMMDERHYGCLLVTGKEERIVGIVTERDIVRRAAAKGCSLKVDHVESIMTAPIMVVKVEATVEDALSVMAANKIRRLPVVDENGLRGLVTLSDVARALAEKLGYENTLLDAMAREPKLPEGVYE